MIARWKLVLLASIFVVTCKPLYKPDVDIGNGRLIFKNTCQGQPLYLVTLDQIIAYESGYNYDNSATVQSATYEHVIRLDSTQSDFFSKKKIGDKLTMQFHRGYLTPLPNCPGLSSGSVD